MVYGAYGLQITTFNFLAISWSLLQEFLALMITSLVVLLINTAIMRCVM